MLYLADHDAGNRRRNHQQVINIGGGTDFSQDKCKAKPIQGVVKNQEVVSEVIGQWVDVNAAPESDQASQY